MRSWIAAVLDVPLDTATSLQTHLLNGVLLCKVVNAIHCGVALGYMAFTGHYFKHAAAANYVTSVVEANNYFNMPALLWNVRTLRRHHGLVLHGLWPQQW